MFSNRIHGESELSPLFRRREQLLAEGRSILDLTILNPTLVGVEYPLDRIREAITRSSGVEYEPHPFGSIDARKAISRDYRERGIEIAADRICLTSSTSESLSFLLKLFGNPGDSVLVPRPGYPLLEHIAPLEGLTLEPYIVAVDGTFACGGVSPSVRAAVVTAPHMPFGSVPDRPSIERLESLCRVSDAALVVDEVFAHYAERSLGPLHDLRVPVFRLGGLSKCAGLPGFKIAWIGRERDDDATRSRLELIADTYLSPNQIAMGVLPELLEIAPGIRAAIGGRIEENLRSLRDAGFAGRLLSSGASWTAVIAIEGDDEKVAMRLLERGVWVQPGFLYDIASPALVLSLITRRDVFEAGLARIADACKSLGSW